jgi:glutathione S-transferase
MRLIGMLDSPYVRRVAISLEALGIDFVHEPVSVFATFEKFKSINPIVKAPTLVLDNGEILMDSSLILQFIERTNSNGKSLWSDNNLQLQREFKCVGVALAACDKAVQYVYDTKLKPESAHHQPWLDRVMGQIVAALSLLELEISKREKDFLNTINQENITAAVVWQFIDSMLPQITRQGSFSRLNALSERMETTMGFIKYLPSGPGVK